MIPSRLIGEGRIKIGKSFPMVRRDMGQRVLTRNAALYYNTINNKKERRGCESVSGAVLFC